MNKSSKLSLWLGLAFLTLACQGLGDLSFNNQTIPTPTPVSLPHSTFVPPEVKSQVLVDAPLPLETHHLTGLFQELDTLEIFINGQPFRTEATSGQATFPPELATIEIVTRNDVEEKVLLDRVVSHLPPACQAVLRAPDTGPVLNLPQSSYPSSDWNVCYIWTGHIPGTYDVSMVATDQSGARTERITQRIEVIGRSP